MDKKEEEKKKQEHDGKKKRQKRNVKNPGKGSGRGRDTSGREWTSQSRSHREADSGKKRNGDRFRMEYC